MSPRFKPARTSAVLGVLTSMLVLPACTTGGPILTAPSSTLGGTATPTPTPAATATPTPTPTATPVASPTPTPIPGGATVTVTEGTLSLPGGYIAIFDSYQFSVPGSLDFVADWVAASNDIDLAVANGQCTSDQLSQGACTFAGLEESATLKPEQLTLAIGAATYTPLIGNFTDPTETIAYRITFTPNASASAADVKSLIADIATRLKRPTAVPASRPFGSKR